MSGSSFPERRPAAGERAVGGHRLDGGGAFVPGPAEVATVPAALGLWTTAADLIRFALGLSAPVARGAAASLVVKLDNGKAYVALTNRGIPIETVNGRVAQALADS